MTVSELSERLRQCSPDAIVVIRDFVDRTCFVGIANAHERAAAQQGRYYNCNHGGAVNVLMIE